MMTRLLLVAAAVLVSVPAFAQDSINPGWRGPSFTLPSIDLAVLGIGPAFPIPIETDGDERTTEWALIAQGGHYLFVPATGCVEPLSYYTPWSFTNTKSLWVVNLIKIAPEPRHQVIVFDIDASDGSTPASLQPIAYTRCQPH